MTEQTLPLTAFYKGWDGFQLNLVKVVAPLSAKQLALPTAPNHWSIGMVVQHILANRVWWFQFWLGQGNPELAAIASWGWEEERPVGTAAELVDKLEATWQMMQDALDSWTPADLGEVIVSDSPALSEAELQMFGGRTRQWIIWHVIEHEILHSGELSLALGTYGLQTIYG